VYSHKSFQASSRVGMGEVYSRQVKVQTAQQVRDGAECAQGRREILVKERKELTQRAQKGDTEGAATGF
jgi:hypothetical protein